MGRRGPMPGSVRRGDAPSLVAARRASPRAEDGAEGPHARIGQKGRCAHRWWLRGERPLGLCDRRFQSTYLFAAVCPATGADFALVMPKANTKAMIRFLDDFSKTLAPDVQVLLSLTQPECLPPKNSSSPPTSTRVLLRLSAPKLNPS